MKRTAPAEARVGEGAAGARFAPTVRLMDRALQKWCVVEDYSDYNNERAKTSADTHTCVVLRFGPIGSTRRVAVLRNDFPAAVSDQEVDAGRETHKDDVAQFAGWAEQRILRAEANWFGFAHRTIPYALDVGVYTTLGYARLCHLYGRFPRCRALHLRELQRVNPALELWTLAFGACVERSLDTKPNAGTTFVPLRQHWNPFRLGQVKWPVPAIVSTQDHMTDLVSAWSESCETLTQREKWVLIASACAFLTWPLPRIMNDVVFVALEPGSPAETRFRAVVHALVLEVTRAKAWPKGVTSPWFVMGGDLLEQDTSRAFTFSSLDTLPGAKVQGVVAGGLVASVMSTHWFLSELVCTEDCPCRLANDLDVFTTNISHADVKVALRDVPKVNVTETPFSSVERLFISFDMTHNQGALVVAPDGALWVAATPYAFASWATMHTLCTGARYTEKRVTKAAQKGFVVHTCGVPVYKPSPGDFVCKPESTPDFENPE